MPKLSNFIIITGALTSGKTTLCHKLSKKLSKNWYIDGVLSYTKKRTYSSKEKGLEYFIHSIRTKKDRLWAKRETPKSMFSFNEAYAQEFTSEILNHQQKRPKDIIIADNLGFHEMKEQGFHRLITEINSDRTQIIISVQKDMLKEFMDYYQFDNHTLIDLDEIAPDKAFKTILGLIRRRDGELIGTFASMTTIMEVGLGTTLNALRVPMKGAFLAGLQNFMLIIFGKTLRGRGLLSIVTITAGLKSFSLAGSRFRPMFYIFFQGFFFILPTYFLGWNFVSVLIGSVLLGLSTFFLGVLLNSIVFGTSYVYANINVVRSIIEYLGINNLSVWDIVFIIIAFKTLIGVVVAFSAFFLRFDKFMSKLEVKVKGITPSNNYDFLEQSTWKNSFKGGARDLLNIKFLTSLIFLSLIIYFFAKLNTNDFILVVVRAIILSWFGFVLSRRINFLSILGFLKKNNYHHLAYALEKSLGIVNSFRRRES